MNLSRTALHHPPTESFTLQRNEHKQFEHLKLVESFAEFLTKITDHKVNEETFEADLLDGVCLCRLMQKLQGSGGGNSSW